MAGDRLQPAQIAMSSGFPDIRWIDPAANPWGVRLLDVRPVTQGMLSTSSDPECAANALSYGHEDGSGFTNLPPNSTRNTKLGLRYRIDGPLADGALFIPASMEHKWAIFHRAAKILFVRSWTRELYAMADVTTHENEIELTEIRGDLITEDEDEQFKRRVVDYILRSHVLEEVYPAPLPRELSEEPMQAALWCFSCFGSLALVATPEEISYAPPEEPMRIHSREP
jgi:hypothetical protein